MAKLFECFFNPELGEDERVSSIHYDVNTSIAGYVWLPFRFDGKMAYLDLQDEWRLEDYI